MCESMRWFLLSCVFFFIARVSCECTNTDPSNMARVNFEHVMCGSPCVAVINAGVSTATACDSVANNALWENGRCITRCDDMAGHSTVLLDKSVRLCRSAAGVTFQQYNGSLRFDSGVSYTLPLACKCSDAYGWFTYGPKFYFSTFSMDSNGFRNDVNFCRYGYYFLIVAQLLSCGMCVILFVSSIILYSESGENTESWLSFILFVVLTALIPFSVILWTIILYSLGCVCILYCVMQIVRKMYSYATPW
jgi:hypothetical protein